MSEISSDENLFFDDSETFVLIFTGETGVCCSNTALIYTAFLAPSDIDFQNIWIILAVRTTAYISSIAQYSSDHLKHSLKNNHVCRIYG